MIISLQEYFGPWINSSDVTEDVEDNANEFLSKVDGLLREAQSDGVDLQINPATWSHISGQQYGGFRPQSCKQGASKSSHKVGRGVDVFDPGDALDNRLTDEILARHGLYREHPDKTPGWCHLTDRAPGSGHRTFWP